MNRGVNIGWVMFAVQAGLALGKHIATGVARRRAKRRLKRQIARQAVQHIRALLVGAKKLAKAVNTIRTQIEAGALTDWERDAYLSQLREMKQTAALMLREATAEANNYAKVYGLGITFEVPPDVAQAAEMGWWRRWRRKRRRKRRERKERRRSGIHNLWSRVRDLVVGVLREADRLVKRLEAAPTPPPTTLWAFLRPWIPAQRPRPPLFPFMEVRRPKRVFIRAEPTMRIPATRIRPIRRLPHWE